MDGAQNELSITTSEFTDLLKLYKSFTEVGETGLSELSARQCHESKGLELERLEIRAKLEVGDLVAVISPLLALVT